MRFAILLVSTIAGRTATLTSAPTQQLPRLDVVLPGHRLVIQLELSRVRVCRPESPDNSSCRRHQPGFRCRTLESANRGTRPLHRLRSWSGTAASRRLPAPLFASCAKFWASGRARFGRFSQPERTLNCTCRERSSRPTTSPLCRNSNSACLPFSPITSGRHRPSTGPSPATISTLFWPRSPPNGWLRSLTEYVTVIQNVST